MSFSTIGGTRKEKFPHLVPCGISWRDKRGWKIRSGAFCRIYRGTPFGSVWRIRSCFFFSVAEKKNSRKYIRGISVNYFPSNETCRTPRSLLIPPFPLCFVVIPTATGKERTQGESKSDENIPISERWSSVKRGQA